MHARLFIFMISVFVLSLSLGACQNASSRQERIAQRGEHVMPFELDKTMHHFEPKQDGGLQRVVAREGVEERQVTLIRKHLRHEAKRFQRGDFADPSRIHGEDMPGLQTLQTNAERIDIQYSDIPRGGQIRYRAEDPALLQAIHRWFKAQVSDHGRHAAGH